MFSIIRATTEEIFYFAAYKDVYTENLTKVIEANVAGQEIVAPPAKEQPQIINLMDALRASLAKTEEKAATPEKKMASRKGKAADARKRKSS